MLRRLRNLDRQEGGFAIAVVMLGGMVLVLITTVAASRAARQVGTVSDDIRWEQSLHVAESCLDVGLVSLSIDGDWTTGETLDPGNLGDRAERDWAVAAGDDRLAADLIATPEGECAIIKPSNADFVYAVGFTPSRSATDRRVRVVRGAVSPGAAPFTVTFAFLTNDDLGIPGNPSFHGNAASAHTNNGVGVSGNPTFHDGCLTASDGGSISGNLNVHATCPAAPYSVPVIEIPLVDARDFWHLSEYDLCPDGRVRAGPAHPNPGFAGFAGSTPCSVGSHVLQNNPAAGYRGWQFDGIDAQDGAQWSYTSNSANHGAYYVYQGSAVVSSGPGSNNNPWQVLIVAESTGSCSSGVAGSQVGGDVVLSGSMAMVPYQAGSAHADNHFVAVADRDVDWNGNGKLKSPGIVAAKEQISIDGNVDVEGAFVAEGRCDSDDDHVDTTSINGNPTFTLSGALSTFWMSDGGTLAVVGWDEL